MEETQTSQHGADVESSTCSWREHHPPGLMQTLGPLLSRGERTARAYGLHIDERHLNPAGLVHGGTVTALLDHALSAIAWEANDRIPCVTVQLNMNFLRAAQPGDTLSAEGAITHQSGSMIFMDGTVRAGATLIATGQAIVKRTRKQ